jgi:hypothetical protein|tara:strand:- start:20 stop:268 length:249 start_codon:yes stop_codon:yes gene_type:complete
MSQPSQYMIQLEENSNSIDDAIWNYFNDNSGDELEPLIKTISQEVFATAGIVNGYGLEHDDYRKIILIKLIHSAVQLLAKTR